MASVLAHIRPWLAEAEGITISGGEPFDQPEALLILLKSLRESTALDILVYSGHPIEIITPILKEATGLIDVLISDPFEIQTPHSYPLRGSDNQRLHLLTQLGNERFSQYQRLLGDSDKQLDVMFDRDGTVWFDRNNQREDDFQTPAKIIKTTKAIRSISAPPRCLVNQQNYRGMRSHDAFLSKLQDRAVRRGMVL